MTPPPMEKMQQNSNLIFIGTGIQTPFIAPSTSFRASATLLNTDPSIIKSSLLINFLNYIKYNRVLSINASIHAFFRFVYHLISYAIELEVFDCSVIFHNHFHFRDYVKQFAD